ncbi:MAG: pseudouridine synthase [Xanthomonadaceae bacterium]|nr:pseudouridine synthase [Xanthomonadaceae bacterium]
MLIACNKPYGTLCQFTDERHEGAARPTLAALGLPPGVYAAGRLDRDSEGLLLLSDDGGLIARIASPAFKWPKTYLVQIEGEPAPDLLERLCLGVRLNDGPARALRAERVAEPDWLWPRDPPVRQRKTVPDAWIELVLDEGRNRQVRRMTAAVGLPTLRLIRTGIGPYGLDGLRPGDWRELAVEPNGRRGSGARRAARTGR